MDTWLATERLALRRFTPADLGWVAGLFTDPDVMRYMGGPWDQEKIEDMFQVRMLDYYARHPGLGAWVTLEQSTGSAIGFHLLNYIQGESFIQVGYFIDKASWGKGFATEMATRLLRYGFSDLGLTQITAITHLENIGSQHVLLKAGLHRHGQRSFAHPAYAPHGPQAWFERGASDWLAEKDHLGGSGGIKGLGG
jgi:ribosomal-protein-alanine N-acetyltransferase